MQFCSCDRARVCAVFASTVIFTTLTACGGASFNLMKSMAPPAFNGIPGGAAPGPAAIPPPTSSPPPMASPTPTTSGSQPSVPASAVTYGNIQSKPGWQGCTAKLNGATCASGRGNAVFAMAQGIQSPSLDGQSAQFSLRGPVGYSNALWWNQLGGNDGAHNFVYDLYVYITQPNAPQSLEFDVNQSIASQGLKFIFGTECDLQATHVWHNWDTAHAKWRNTSVPCKPFPAYTWNHLVLQFQRMANNKILFVAVTINGQTHYFNKQFDPERTSAEELNVAFQMDGNSHQTPYSVWLDKVTLRAW